VVRFRDTGIHRFVGILTFRLRLTGLELVEIQRLLVVPNGRPCQILPDGIFQFAQPIRIGSQKDERVLVIPGRRATRIENGCRLLAGGTFFVSRFTCGNSGPRITSRASFSSGMSLLGNAGINPGKVRTGAACFPQPFDDLVVTWSSLSWPARSSASRATVGCVEYQYRLPST
jgi:hypothetical protein